MGCYYYSQSLASFPQFSLLSIFLNCLPTAKESKQESRAGYFMPLT